MNVLCRSVLHHKSFGVLRASSTVLGYTRITSRNMATVREDSIPHIVRTAHERRIEGVWKAKIGKIEQVNRNIRLIRLNLDGEAPARTHLPGQYVDLYLPNIEAVGGFTITSPPSTTRLSTSPYIELAIQKSPNNPPAAHLWQPAQDILNTPASFRIGGSFIYPPPTFSRDECGKIDRAVFVAGGVGINPIMSMLSAMNSAGPRRIGGLPAQTRVLYTSRRSRDDNNKPEAVLFEDRLQQLAHSWANSKDVDYQYTFFETSKGGQTGEDKNIRYQDRRIQHADLLEALGPEDQRSNTVIYVCGLPAMTDEFVEILRKAKGMDQRRVLVEKWW